MRTQLWTFDTETTGVDVEADRIVSAALARLDEDGTVLEQHEWLLNPGIPIPAAASFVHGITDEHVADAMPAAHGVDDIQQCLADLAEGDEPLVVFNAPFDLTLLDREMQRHLAGIPLGFPLILDPMVIDQHVDTYRKGSRTLAAVAEFHGVPFAGDAHGALADAITSGRLAQRLLAYPRFDRVVETGLTALHDAQRQWARARAESRYSYYLGRGDIGRAESVRMDWPLVPREAAA